MNTTERNYLINLLKKSEAALLAVVEDVSEEFFAKKSAEDKWSMADIVEHLVITDTGLFRRIQKEGENIDESIPQILSNERVVKVVTSRDKKVTAPSFLIPQGRFKNKTEAIQAFAAIRSKVSSFIETTELPLEKITFKHFLLGFLDGKGWIAFMAGHCRRHTLQIQELKQE